MTLADTFIHPTALVDEGAFIGKGCRIWQFCVVSKGARLGESCKLGHNVFVESGVVVGSGCTIKDNVALYTGVTIEEDVFVGPNVVFTNVRVPRAFLSRKAEFEPTIVRRGASLGANATLRCGIEIGQYAMIGSGAVVTRNVLDHALMVGTPARQVGWVGRSGRILSESLICPESGERYQIAEHGGLGLAEPVGQ